MTDEEVTRKEVQELKEQIEDLVEVAEENNKILHQMRRIGRIAFFAKALMWTIVLILPFVLIPLISPYLHLLQIPGIGGTSTSTSLFGYPSPEQLERALDTYKSGL